MRNIECSKLKFHTLVDKSEVSQIVNSPMQNIAIH